MKLEKKHYVIIAVVVAIIAIWYFFLRKKPTTSNYISKDKRKDRTKVCSCTYLGKPNKICSHSVNCNLCCEGAGTSGQEFVADINGNGLLS